MLELVRSCPAILLLSENFEGRIRTLELAMEWNNNKFTGQLPFWISGGAG